MSFFFSLLVVLYPKSSVRLPSFLITSFFFALLLHFFCLPSDLFYTSCWFFCGFLLPSFWLFWGDHAILQTLFAFSFSFNYTFVLPFFLYILLLLLLSAGCVYEVYVEGDGGPETREKDFSLGLISVIKSSLWAVKCRTATPFRLENPNIKNLGQ